MKNSIWITSTCFALALTVGCSDDPDSMAADGGTTGSADAGTTGSADAGTTGSADAGTTGSADAGTTGAQPRGASNMPSLGKQIDRTGRPAISTALQATFEADEATKGDARDAYNAAGPDEWADFAPGLAGSLAILDALDGTCGNQLLAGDPGPERYSMLAGILADDQLYVNADSDACGTYLGLEAEIVGVVGAGEGGCGGRTPTDDIIERSYSVLAAGTLTGIDDTITEDDADHDPTTFPFLAAP